MELWDLYTENRVRTGKTVDRSMYGHIWEDYFHLWVQVWIKNSKGQYVFSQRAADKNTDPLKWECVAGHSLAGETSVDAAVREAKEEVGITLDPAKGIKLLTRIRERVDGISHFNIHDVWLFESDEKPNLSKALTPEEVAKTGYRSLDEIVEMYKNGETTENIRYAYSVAHNKPNKNYDIIGKIVRGTIDRPVGSHFWDEHEVLYRLNVGKVCEDADDKVNLKNAPDVYVIDSDKPMSEFEGTVVAVYHRYSDDSDIYIVSLNGTRYSEDDILAKIAFREQYYYGVLCFS